MYYKFDGDRQYRFEKQSAIFQTALGLRTMYKAYFKKVEALKGVPHWKMTKEEKAFTKYRKLYKHDRFTEQQLFFLIYFRVSFSETYSHPKNIN